jgi:hypothetical protein
MTRFSQFAAPAILGAALMVGGCASDPDVSADADLLSEGRRTVTASAPHDGSFYIFDKTSSETVYRGKVEKGDTIRVDAKNDRVLLNDDVALTKDLINDHRYQIFFDRKELSEADMARYRQDTQGTQGTVIQTPAGGTTVITPPPSGSNTTVVQPPPAPNTTVVQPPPPPTVVQPPPQPRSDTTVIPPPPAPEPAQPGTSAQPGTTVVQPDGTTIVAPAR